MQKCKKIAILGAGFCGLAVAHHLSRYTDKGLDLEISIIDAGAIGDNASGISAGLLYPYPGLHSKLARLGIEGFLETLKLIQIATHALNTSVAENTGLLRLALSDNQKHDYKLPSNKYDSIRWCEAEECQEIAPHSAKEPGIFIESAHIVKTKLYLEGLWAACKKKNVLWIKDKIDSLTQLVSFDVIIVTNGASIIKLPELSHLPIQPIKGQILEISWPDTLKIPLSSNAYLVPGNRPNTCFLGATFERNFNTEKADREHAAAYLKPKLQEIFPSLNDIEIVNCYSGVRASGPKHLPLIKRETENVWVLTGMGSKGLLYHALYAKELVDQMFKTSALSSSSSLSVSFNFSSKKESRETPDTIS